MEMSTYLDDFETFEDGIYFVIYEQDKKLEKGTLPEALMWMHRLSPVGFPGTIHLDANSIILMCKIVKNKSGFVEFELYQF